MSSSLRALSSRPDCSPSTQRSASAMLDFPEPFGPTMAVIPWPKSNRVLEAKLLKPWSSRRFKYTSLGPSVGGCQSLQGLPRGGQLGLLLVAALPPPPHFTADKYFYREKFRVVRPLRRDEPVLGYRMPARLRQVLQLRLAVRGEPAG